LSFGGYEVSFGGSFASQDDWRLILQTVLNAFQPANARNGHFLTESVNRSGAAAFNAAQNQKFLCFSFL
jgi:hypothetical protein